MTCIICQKKAKKGSSFCAKCQKRPALERASRLLAYLQEGEMQQAQVHGAFLSRDKWKEGEENEVQTG